MGSIKTLKLLVTCLFVCAVVSVLLTGRIADRTAHARSSGPDAGFTHAPGEFDCAECHLPESAGSGKFTIDAPQFYTPGQTYEIKVSHTSADPTRIRWGFQLTALDDANQRAGNLESHNGETQILAGQGAFPDRQYVEHTSFGTFNGKQGGADWKFYWTAPASDIGSVVLYAAGNQANGDGNTSGDNIYYTFTTIVPSNPLPQPSPDFFVNVTQSTRTVTPGGSTTYDINVIPTSDFTGQVTLGLSGLPPGASASFNPASLNIDSASVKSSTLTLTTDASTPPAIYPLTITGTSGSLTRSGQTQLNVVAVNSADLSVSQSASPNPVSLGSNLTYRITVTNNGTANATGVVLTERKPELTEVVSVTPSQGQCQQSLDTTCALGNLLAGESATVVVVVRPSRVGQITNNVSVSANEDDPSNSNNVSAVTTNVELAGLVPKMLAPRLGVRTVVAGLSMPTGMAFIGANDFLVLEKNTGKVQRVAGGQIRSTALDLAVNNASERGLLGIALHPHFNANGLVYLFWTESTTGADTSNIDEVPLLGNRVDRYVWDGQTLTFERNIIRLRALQQDAGQQSRGNHNGGVLRFGADGKLYVVIGDNGRRGLLQNVKSGGTVPDDAFGGPEPDDAHLTGVVLRLNDDGTTPADNPFSNAATTLAGEAAANVRKVFAYGIRNSFGMDFDPLSGKLWMQENGDDAFDEINRVEAGFNGGWIQLMGPSSRVAEYRSIETSRSGGLQQNRWPATQIASTPAEALQRLYELPGSHYPEPEFSWKYAVAPSALGFVRGRGLGPLYEGALFVGASRPTLVGGYLFAFRLSGDRQHVETSVGALQDRVADNADKFDLTESESLLAGRDFGVATDIQTAPDGNLYVVSLSNGAVYEIYAQPSAFVARLYALKVVPPSASDAQGIGTVVLSPDETTARVSLRLTGLKGTQTGAHLHAPATAFENAPALFTLPNGSFDDFQITLTPQQAEDLKRGLFYFDVHTDAFPGGAIRGQVDATRQSSPSVVEFDAPFYQAREEAGSITLTVNRLGDLSNPATVDYATESFLADERTDFTTARGTLRFAPGEHSKNIQVFITDDAFDEGSESFYISLSNPTGAAAIGTFSRAQLLILNNDPPGLAANPIDDAQFFVRQHYLDFLNREPDADGFRFWTNQITECETRPANERQECREIRRINVSAAFFLSVEFQQTGFFVYRFNEATFDQPPRFDGFMSDTQEIGRGIVVGQGDWQAQLEANKRSFADRWVQSPAFRNLYDALTNEQYVNKLNTNARGALDAEQSAALVAALDNGTETRATALRKIVESEVYKSFLRNRAFVLMQYFGYLRRNPDDPPDGNSLGYLFWLDKLNRFGGNYISAEMVKAFITSGEYRGRFGR